MNTSTDGCDCFLFTVQMFYFRAASFNTFVCRVFQTTVTAVDLRTPQRTGQGTIIINVNYDDFAPVITSGNNGLIEAVITENVNIGTSVARVTAEDRDIQEDGQVGSQAIKLVR